jgi:hypothetical protein
VADALEVAGRHRRSLRVDANHAGRTTFPVRASTAADQVTVRASAVSSEAGDAIEQTLKIEPFGRQVQRTRSALIRDRTSLPVAVPGSAMAGTASASLRIFPNLAAHLSEGMEGIMHRPYGCGEQLTSAGWVALLLLEHIHDSGLEDSELERRAQRHVRAAVTRLEQLASADGGFRFWRRGEPEPLLTAYALRFLIHAEQQVEVEPDLISRAATWLIAAQDEDGAWHEDRPRRTDDSFIQDTAFIVRALAEVEAGDEEEHELISAAVTRALDFLQPHLSSFDEPHALAGHALACLGSDRTEAARQAVQRLAGLAAREGDTAYWQVHRNTPLMGWGLPGRIETTALVVLALRESGDEQHQLLADAGLLYLLRHKDPNSVWYSTQATVAALEAMIASGLDDSGGELQVLVEGQPPLVIPLPEATTQAISLELPAPEIGAGGTVKLHSSAGSTAVAELQLGYYLPWPEPPVTAEQQGNLAFSVDHDRYRGQVGESITCTVTAERIAHRGRGMLMAEIGLPPGAEVDRLALEQDLGWRGSFEVRPDRVILYLWARPGGNSVTFSFTPRFAGDMVSAPSNLYDYYNPELRVDLPPQRFVISEGG